MSRPKTTLSVFEYSKQFFSEPLAASTSRALHLKCKELKRHLRADILRPLYDSHGHVEGVEARQYVGVVRINDTLSIQILPKMSASDDKQTSYSQSIENLLYMLKVCGKLPSSHSSSSALKTLKDDFYEILIYLYATTLMNEIKNNLHHEYIAQEQNLAYLRGKLLIKEHVLTNSITQDKFYLSADEFIPDNSLNQVFAFVVRRLLSSTNNVGNKRILGELSLMFSDVTQKTIYLQDAEKIELNRLSKRFAPSLELAKLFLSGRSLMLKNDKFDTSTFLIDMNSLFEEFISKMLKKAVSPDTIVYTQKPQKYLVAKQSSESMEDTKPVFMMKPDISLAYRDSPDQIFHIIDTKYKILDDSQRKMNVSQADLYQMYAYAKRYEANQITLLYPLRSGQEIEEKTLYIKGLREDEEDCEISIRFIDLTCNLRLNTGRLQEKLRTISDGRTTHP